MMDELLKGLARKLAVAEGASLSFEDDLVIFERVLRESGLSELLEAGERMKVRLGTHRQYGAPEAIDWESSTNRLRAALAGAEKGREGK